MISAPIKATRTSTPRAWICALTLSACFDTQSPTSHPPVADCIELPARATPAHADRTRTRAQELDGCRSFDDSGCSICCHPTDSLDGTPDCLELGASGERLLGGDCPDDCEPCAACTTAREQAVRDFASQDTCSCADPRALLGCDPDDPCDCFCLDLEVAARMCSHLVCER